MYTLEDWLNGSYSHERETARPKEKPFWTRTEYGYVGYLETPGIEKVEMKLIDYPNESAKLVITGNGKIDEKCFLIDKTLIIDYSLLDVIDEIESVTRCGVTVIRIKTKEPAVKNIKITSR